MENDTDNQMLIECISCGEEFDLNEARVEPHEESRADTANKTDVGLKCTHCGSECCY